MMSAFSIVLFVFALTFRIGLVNGQTVTSIAQLFTTTLSGDGTYYGAYTSGGACSLDPTPTCGANSALTVAISTNYYTLGTSGSCGMCVNITGNGVGVGGSPFNGSKIAFINNECPSCDANGIDFGLSGDGVWNIMWTAVPCPCAGSSISYKYQGTSQYYLQIQIVNHCVPVGGVSINTGRGWVALVRTPDNFWENSNNDNIYPLPSTFQIQTTSVFGDVVVDTVPFARSGPVNGGGVQLLCSISGGSTLSSTTAFISTSTSSSTTAFSTTAELTSTSTSAISSPSTTGSSGCYATVSSSLTSSWLLGGQVEITVTNTGTLPIQSVNLEILGSVNVLDLLDLESDDLYSLPSSALPLSVSSTFTTNSTFLGSQPSVSLSSVGC